MLAILGWLFGSSLIGWLFFPVTFRIFNYLPSRGYAFTRGLSLLIWGYFFWLLTMLGVLENTGAGQSLVLGTLILLALYCGYRRGFREIKAWFSREWRFVIGVELIFVSALIGFAIFRAASPAILGTEKPMELAFLNAILRAKTFPPHDPWLSGYSISYYYFGYVLVAMLTRLTGTVSTVAFNLAQALWFALIAASAYGLAVDLFALTEKKAFAEVIRISAWMRRWALAAPLLLLIMGNLFAPLDVLHARGVFWHKEEDERAASNVWDWVGLPALEKQPPEPYQWTPQRPGAAPWWHASRVLQDETFSGEPVEVIDEFPNFSFILGDLHPHLLAMPFVLIAIGFALNFYHSQPEQAYSILNWKLPIHPGRFLMVSGVMGALTFLNTWDWPVYVSLYAAVFFLKRVKSAGWAFKRVVEFIAYGLGLAVFGYVFYLPFFINFSSQAAGVLPSLIYFTRGIHQWVMFGPLLLLIIPYGLWRFKRHADQGALRKALSIIATLFIALILINGVITWVAVSLTRYGALFMANQGALGVPLRALFKEALVRRLLNPGTYLTLGVLLALCLSIIISNIQKPVHRTLPTHDFVILLILWGVLLTLIPEFIYLLDSFGKRMNTIFKFYYQAWILWSLAGAFVLGQFRRSIKPREKSLDRWLGWLFMSLTLLVLFFIAVAPSAGRNELSCPAFGCYLLDWLFAIWGATFVVSLVYFVSTRRWGGLYRTLIVLGVGAGLFYPALAIPARTNAFRTPERWTLDGSQPYHERNPDLMAAVDWLWEKAPAILAEAISPDGGDYSDYARVSMLSGFPTVLGWQYHEVQWRGGTAEIGTRVSDIARLYETDRWETAKAIIDKYNIEYIYIGDLEHAAYEVQETKFMPHFSLVFQQGNVKIYYRALN